MGGYMAGTGVTWLVLGGTEGDMVVLGVTLWVLG